jgi:hypothetical protein
MQLGSTRRGDVKGACDLLVRRAWQEPEASQLELFHVTILPRVCRHGRWSSSAVAPGCGRRVRWRQRVTAARRYPVRPFVRSDRDDVRTRELPGQTGVDVVHLDDNSKIADAFRVYSTYRACALGHFDAAQRESRESQVKATLMRSEPLTHGTAQGSGQSKPHVRVGWSAGLILADAALQLRAWVGPRASFGHLHSFAAAGTQRGTADRGWSLGRSERTEPRRAPWLALPRGDGLLPGAVCGPSRGPSRGRERGA